MCLPGGTRHGAWRDADGPEVALLALHAAGTRTSWVSGVPLEDHTQAGAACSQHGLLSRRVRGFWGPSWPHVPVALGGNTDI